jgi:hypothetical protein
VAGGSPVQSQPGLCSETLSEKHKNKTKMKRKAEEETEVPLCNGQEGVQLGLVKV